MSIAEKLTTIAENEQKVYDKGFADGQSQGGGDVTKNPMYYMSVKGFQWQGKVFPEGFEFVLNVLNKPDDMNAMLMRTTGIKNVTLVCEEEGTVSYAQTLRECPVETLDITNFKPKPTSISYFAYIARKLISIYGAFDLSQCTTAVSSFAAANALEDVEFVPNTIKLSMGFTDCEHLTKASLTSIINGLNTDVTEQTLTLSSTAKTNAFTDEEWATLIEAKPNWTISLM
ncbi:MAG: hypothetical protein E7410_00860 [Ruminococcaceae bacterium]|nr:hypothetical protein [Oscillospiraceae bacterium]